MSKQNLSLLVKSIRAAKPTEIIDPKNVLKNLPGIVYVGERSQASVGQRRVRHAGLDNDIAKMERVHHGSQTKPDADTQARRASKMDPDVAAFFYQQED